MPDFQPTKALRDLATESWWSLAREQWQNIDIAVTVSGDSIIQKIEQITFINGKLASPVSMNKHLKPSNDEVSSTLPVLIQHCQT
jgi:hypothetical protein